MPKSCAGPALTRLQGTLCLCTQSQKQDDIQLKQRVPLLLISVPQEGHKARPPGQRKARLSEPMAAHPVLKRALISLRSGTWQTRQRPTNP